MALKDMGYLDRICLSHDASYDIKFIGGQETFKPEFDDILVGYNWTHVFTNILPALKEKGLSEEELDMLIAKNPQRFYGAEE